MMRSRTILLTTTSLLTASAAVFAPKDANAQLALSTTTATSTTLATTGTVQQEIVYDLGDYDPYPVKHTAYSLVTSPVIATDALLVSDGSTTTSSSNCPAPTATYDWDRTYYKADDFGNSTFGAGYWAGIIFSSRAGRAGGPDTFSGEGLLKGYVTVFGSDKELVRISGKATLTGSQGTSGYYVRVLGVNVRSKSVSGNLSGSESLYNASFLSASKTIWLGPVPVKFTGAIKGTIGISYNAQYAMSTLSVETRPNAKLYAYASAGVDLWLASAGVSGSLTLIEAGVPSKAAAVVSPSSVAFSLDSDLQLKSLSGKIEAYATLPGKRWTTTLASWSPLFNATYPIIHIRSCQNPIVRPVCGDAVCQSGESYLNCAADCPAPPPEPGGDDYDVPLYCQSKPWMCQDL
jgi:hypothetical protein